MKRLFKQFSFPGGIPSHAAPETPGSIHEGGELGYSLLHAYGAVFDNPDLIACCVVGDGEAETGPLADQLALQQVPESGARRRGAADPASERLQDRRSDGAGAHSATRNCGSCFDGYGYEPYFVEGDDPATMHQLMAATLDDVMSPRSARFRQGAREHGFHERPRLADDRPAHAQGLDRPEGGRRQAGRRAHSARTRCRSPRCAASPTTSACSKSG